MEPSLLIKYYVLFFLLVQNSNCFFGKFDGNGYVDVQTNSGPIQGSEIVFRGNRLQQFLGIPFVQPPLGVLRFKKPQPVKPWTKSLVANTMPSSCIQYGETVIPIYGSENSHSEDCLYLNIWIPHCREKVPVMFWIYGGAFQRGSTSLQWFNGKALSAIGQVAVVTFNYRLSALGFLNSGTEDAPGNVGIYDMVAALKWVKDNIESFGGDPNQMTVFGESSGSQSVGLLCVSPLTKGMFHRVIMESGSPAYLLAENNTANIQESQKLAEAVGCANSNQTIYNNPKDVVDCLKNVDANFLFKTLYSYEQPVGDIFYPNYGDEILPENARIAIRNGQFHKAEVLAGDNKDEGSIMLILADTQLFGKLGHKNPKLDKSTAADLLRKSFKNFEDPEAVIKHYLGGVASEDYDQIRYNAYTAIGDYRYLCPTVYFAESYSKAGNKVYYYFFTHRSSAMPWAEWAGVTHFSETAFVFGNPYRNPNHYTNEEVKLSIKMMKTWSNFAKYGTPQSNLLEKPWPQYSQQNPEFTELNALPGMQYGKGLHTKNCDFFRKYFGFN